MAKIQIMFLALTTALLAACGGGNDGTSTPPPSTCPTPTTGNMTILGTITYDLVPHKTNLPGLDYTKIIKTAAPWVTVVAVNADTAKEVSRTATDSTGKYQLVVPNNTKVQIKVLAEMVRSAAPSLNISVVDGNNSNAQWTMVGSASCTGILTETRDLNAGSGWVPSGTGGSYANPRTAASFAILDDIYQGIQLVLPALQSTTANPIFPKLLVNWSPDNTHLNILSTHFINDPTQYKIEVLGEQNFDTDEYDTHVIAHEFGHYIESVFSRADNIGGTHILGEFLDMRVAFGEGYGTAFSGISLNNPTYFDTSGPYQASDRINYNIANPGTTYDPNPGWFSETSIAAILYRSYASNYLNRTFQPLFTVLNGPQKNTTALTSVFSFMSSLKSTVSSSQAANLSTLLNSYSINGTTIDTYGSTESNNGGLTASALPIYTSVAVGGATSASLCTEITKNLINATSKTDVYYEANKLGNYRFVRVNISSTGRRTITVTGDAASAPQFRLYSTGMDLYNTITYLPGFNSLSGSVNLAAGEYIIVIYDFNLLDPTASRTSQSCMTVGVK